MSGAGWGGSGDGRSGETLPLARWATPEIPLGMLEAGVARAPRAARIAAGLLPMLHGLPAEQGIAIESLAYAMLQTGEEHRAWLAARATPQPHPPGRLGVARHGDALLLRFDRSHARNAIDVALRDALIEALDVAAHDPDIRRIRLSALGPAFSIGGDLAEFGTTRDPVTAHLIRMAYLPALAIARRSARLEAHVQGACVGAGLEIAAFADHLTCTPDAWFQLPEIAMGLIPGAGGCVSVPRRIGVERALALLLSGRRIPARVALSWGLVDAIVDGDAGDEGEADGDVV